MIAAELCEHVTPNRAVPVIFEVREPISSLHDGRPLPHRGVRDARAVERMAEADFLVKLFRARGLLGWRRSAEKSPFGFDERAVVDTTVSQHASAHFDLLLGFTVTTGTLEELEELHVKPGVRGAQAYQVSNERKSTFGVVTEARCDFAEDGDPELPAVAARGGEPSLVVLEAREIEVFEQFAVEELG